MDEQQPKPEPTPEATPSAEGTKPEAPTPTAQINPDPAATPPSKFRPNGEEIFTAEELQGFEFNEDQNELIQSLTSDEEEIVNRRSDYLDKAQKQLAAYDGAVEEAREVRRKTIYRAHKKFVEKKRAVEAKVKEQPEGLSGSSTISP